MSKLMYPFALVPQQNVLIIERFGKYVRQMPSGIHFKIPFAEAIAYQHSLKEQVIDIDSQTAITRDNVKIKIDGVLYYKITDPFKASYAVAEPIRALSLLAQTSMRSEIGLLELDRTFEEREHLNVNIKSALNNASEKWGIDCMRYEIKDIKPPEQIKRSMELQAESERIKRSKILNSEGEKQSKINIAEGYKQGQILEGEGAAQKIIQEARSIVESLQNIADACILPDGTTSQEALRLRLSEQYIRALNEIYGEMKIIVLPEAVQSDMRSGNPMSAANIATALTLFKNVIGKDGIAPSADQIKNMAGDASALSDLITKVDTIQQNVGKGGQTASKYRYLDDKALYQ